MGNLLSISISIENLFASCWDSASRPANYVHKLEKNQLALGVALGRLTELRNDVKRKVEVAERLQMKPLDQVQGWLLRVEALQVSVIQIRESPATVGNCVNYNLISSYKLGKKVVKKLEEVAALRREGSHFDAVADMSLPAPVDLRPSPRTVGLESKFEEVWGCLGEDSTRVGVIGLYGLGGVGKTTLMTQINNALYKCTPNDFDVVIWVVVSSDPDPRKVQDEIWKKIGFYDGIWASKSQADKAIDIFQFLNRKRFVLLLDDVWKWLDLLNVGIPLPDKENRSKIVLATRSLEVCCSMGAHKIIKVECLGWEKAWDLFQSKVGEGIINSHPDIPELAKVVANECGGLPLALITIGRAMACKRTPSEWNYAIKVLRSSASNFPGMPEDVLPLLKFSYDSLPDDRARACFLYFSLYPEDRIVYKRCLVDIWIGEGFLDEFEHDRDGARLEGYMIFGTLIRACLLEERGEDFVKMHDVIRDMAIWIASDFGRNKHKFVVYVSARLTHLPEDVVGWTAARRISMINNQIEKLSGAPRCPRLSTLFLDFNSLKLLNGAFFQFMPSIRVLSLTQNEGITELPLEICNLVSLQYLDLSFTSIRELPIELKKLVRLKCLSINCIEALDRIPRGLISSLSTLEVLKMTYSGSSDQISENNALSGGNQILVEELELLKHLGDLSITVKSGSALNQFLSGKSWSYTQDLCIRIFNDTSSIDTSFLQDMKNLNILSISRCSILQDLVVDWTKLIRKETVALNYPKITNYKYVIYGLHTVVIDRCPMLRHLTWLVFASNLRHLFIKDCKSLIEVIDNVVAEEAGEILIPFAKLERLYLSSLPELKSIYWMTLPFHCLKQIHAAGCPNLRKLPMNSGCRKEGGVIIYGEEGWWNNLEWEDEATKTSCIPHLTSQSYNSTPKLIKKIFVELVDDIRERLDILNQRDEFKMEYAESHLTTCINKRKERVKLVVIPQRGIN